MKKTLEAALRSAFEAGIAHGTNYPEAAAIPRGADDKAYQRWHDRWTGRPHEASGGATEKAPEQSLGARLGHPGGHYG